MIEASPPPDPQQPGPPAAGGGPQSSPGAQSPPPGPQGSPAPQAPPPASGSAVSEAVPSPARDVAVWTHLSALVGILGIPSPLGPLVLWLVKRESHPFVDDQGKEALNFNLSALIYIAAISVFGFIFSFLTFGLGVLLFIPVVLAAIVVWLVLVIVAAMRSSKGELFRYPVTIRFVR